MALLPLRIGSAPTLPIRFTEFRDLSLDPSGLKKNLSKQEVINSSFVLFDLGIEAVIKNLKIMTSLQIFGKSSRIYHVSLLFMECESMCSFERLNLDRLIFNILIYF